jgi:hypothetical protein
MMLRLATNATEASRWAGLPTNQEGLRSMRSLGRRADWPPW